MKDLPPYPYRQRDEPALDYYERVARMADADTDYQRYLEDLS